MGIYEEVKKHEEIYDKLILGFTECDTDDEGISYLVDIEGNVNGSQLLTGTMSLIKMIAKERGEHPSEVLSVVALALMAEDLFRGEE